MRIVQLPSREYYILKDKGGTGFIFVPRATIGDCGQVGLAGNVCTPKELVGKRLMFKVEIVEEENAKK